MDAQRSLKNVRKLEEITPTLEDIPSLTGIQKHMSFRQYETVVGGPFSEIVVYAKTAYAIGVDSAPTGTRVREHKHTESTEFYIIARGRVRCTQRVPGEDEPEVYEAGPAEVIRIPPGIGHVCEVLEDCEIIVVTIPAAEGMT